MSEKRVILIADPDVATVRALKKALEDDYEVFLAKDGSKALELSVLRYPDLILFHRHCPLIGASHFLRILRTNPRTEEVPLIVLSDEPITTDTVPGFLQGVLVKPLNMDEVRAHLAAVFRKVDAAKQVVEQSGSVSGTLDQMSMADLLQIFSLNRRSGSLDLVGGPRDLSARVFLRDGRIEDAAVGVARGEKALFRLLTWKVGRFSFVPDKRASSVSMNASTDSLLMEGMRQGDELDRLRPDLPSPTHLLERLVSPEGLPEGLHPVTSEIYELVESYPRVADLIDHGRAADLEVWVAVKALLDANLLRVIETAPDNSDEALLSQDEILDLRSRLRRAGVAHSFLETPKIAIVASSPEEIRKFGVALSRLEGFRVGNLKRLQELPFGRLGRLHLDVGMQVEFYVIAADERLLPLAFGLSAGTVGGIVLGTNDLERFRATLSLLENERRAALLVARMSDEPIPKDCGHRTVLDLKDFSDGSVRRLLTTLFKQVAGTDMRGVSL